MRRHRTEPAAARLGRACALAWAVAWALGGCASAPPPAMAVIAVELEGMPADWPPTLACRASSPAASWEFTAPGTVQVRATGAPLRIECTVPPGSRAAVEVGATRAEEARRAQAVGGGAGAAAGVAAAAAAAPVAGAAMAAAVVVGAVLRGREIAGIIHGLRGGSFAGYPERVRIRIEGAEGPR